MHPRGPNQTLNFATRTPDAAMALVYNHWSNLYKDNTVPKRRDINPMKFAKALDYTFIVEKQPDMPIKFRMAGIHINDIIGCDVRGMPITSLVTATLKAKFQTLLDRTFVNALPTLAHLRWDIAAEEQAALLSVLPLLDDNGNLTRAIGTLQSKHLGTATSGVFQDIVPLNTAEKSTDERPRFKVREYSMGFAEQPTKTWEPKKDAHRSERPYLQLVK